MRRLKIRKSDRLVSIADGIFCGNYIPGSISIKRPPAFSSVEIPFRPNQGFSLRLCALAGLFRSLADNLPSSIFHKIHVEMDELKKISGKAQSRKENGC
jgi:hypothetical protein